ncbi:ATP-binding protein, partial [Hoeflea sp. BAL378]
SGVDAETAATEAWATALALSATVTDDLQGVFLMLAHAAIKGEPCPSDARIARAYGTHSARRARRLLGYFEEQGLIIVHADHSGKRIVGIPELQAETAPGAADAAEDDGRAEAAE